MVPSEGVIRTGVAAGEFERREPFATPNRARTGYAARYARSALPALEGGGSVDHLFMPGFLARTCRKYATTCASCSLDRSHPLVGERAFSAERFALAPRLAFNERTRCHTTTRHRMRNMAPPKG